MRYCDMNREQLAQTLKLEKARYQAFKEKNLSYDMTRGKPGADQLNLSTDLLSDKYIGNANTENGTDCRNYGLTAGIPEIRALFGQLFDTAPEQVIVGGNSSLNMMYDTIAMFLLLGTGSGRTPWCRQGTIKFICPVPGSDRHFAICEQFGIEMIPVEIKEDGPDMEAVEALAANDPAVKGMWSIPKYSNPSGVIYSDEVIRRLASMRCAAEDFRIIWDDAYTVHYLGDRPHRQLSLVRACAEAGNPDRAIMVTSTSKITFPGAGVAAIASSLANVQYLTKLIGIQTIGPDKLNQLRHVHFLKDYDTIVAHMEKHAEILRPKFQSVLSTMEAELDGLDILEWSRPEGGYFISVNTLDGIADQVVAMAKECGVLFTPAGATFPYRKDPRNRNIRIAPTFPPLSQLQEAITVFCVCVKICSLEKLLGD